MHNPLIYIILLTAGLWPQSNPWKEKFISAMNDPRGVSITVEIEQKQFDTNSVERGTIEIVKKDHYLLDTSSETVVVMGDTIQTWNKQSNSTQKYSIEKNIFHQGTLRLEVMLRACLGFGVA